MSMPGPFDRTWARHVSIGEYKHVPCEVFSLSWMHSDRVNGRVVLRGNEMSLLHHRNMVHTERYNPEWGVCLIPLYGHISADQDAIEVARQRALSKWYSKLKGDTSASLGVTIGSWNQSWTMIAKRYKQLSKVVRDVAQKSATRTAVIEKRYAEKFKQMDSRLKDLHFRIQANTSRANLGKPADIRRLKRLRKAEERRRLKAKDALRRDLEKASSANLFLEGIFGWMPLLQDIINTAKTLTGDHFPAGYISASGKNAYAVPADEPSPGNLQVLGGLVQVRSKYTAQVSVENPNVWLANQLGLLNPAAVAWDLIPWSWVVGIFTNVSTVLGSISALYGLSVTDVTRTDETRIVSSVAQDNGYPAGHPGYARSTASASSRFKARAKVVGLPTPALTLRMPKLTMSLGLIAAATTAVQVAKLSRNQGN